MTARTLAMRGLRGAGVRVQVIACAILAAVVVALFALVPAREPANAVTVSLPITRAKAEALVQATNAGDVQAIGEQAKIINAALPFASGPVRAARPFEVSGSDLGQRRALLCLTQAVYYEAAHEPLDGRRAVAQVVLNRMRHPAFPKSVCGVVYQNNGRICQFTFVCDGALNRAPAASAWRAAEAIARAALAGHVEGSVGAATHYHADYVAPRWAPMLAKVSQIGQHIFYRWPGAWGQPAAFTGRYAGEARDPLSLRPTIAALTTSGDDPSAVAAIAGPPVARAENDVGGLLDTSKGWTLNIPAPGESSSAAARLIAEQQGAKKAVEVAAAGAVAANGSR